MTVHRSFPKPGAGIKAAPPKPRAPKAKPTVKKLIAALKTVVKPAKEAKPPKAGPATPVKVKPVDQGNGTFYEALDEKQLAQAARDLAKKLHLREEELSSQAEARKLANGRLADLDRDIHRLQTQIREKRVEKPNPGLFDKAAKKLDEAKEKPLGKDVMAKPDRPKAEGPIETNAPKPTLPVATASEKVADAAKVVTP
jgi:hypothetical protein